jgi:hypothetical protein
MSELQKWLVMKIEAYEEDKEMYGKGSKEYEYANGAAEAYQNVLDKLGKENGNE